MKTKTHATTSTIDSTRTGHDRDTIAAGLSRLLADTWTLYLETQGFHWNVTGPLFPMLHALFEQQYGELAAASDEIAERIRALGFPAPASYAAFAELTTIAQADGVPAAEDMLRQLLEGNAAVARTAHALVPAAEAAADQATLDLLARRIGAHDKHAWMLRSMLR